MTARTCLAILLMLVLTGCGGTKLVRNAAPPPVPATPLAVATDARLAAALQFVIVRNGPGAWAKNADWDEYLLQVRNTGATPVRIDAVTVTDSTGHDASALAARKPLLAASRDTMRRYRDAGLKVDAGRGGGALVAAGVGAGVVGYGAAVAAGTGAALGAGGAAGGGAAAAAGGLILAAPVLVGVGIARMVNNARVDDRVQARATPLPLTLAPGSQAPLDLFFPISPAPQRVVIDYHADGASHRLALDTRQPLSGLHLPAAHATTR